MLTYDKLRELLEYDPETGLWTWLVSVNKRPYGSLAGTVSVHGYLIITFAGVKYRAAKLAHLYMTGEWPSDEMDHIDKDKLNDRWVNLRVASRSENALNRDLQSNNVSDARGVHWDSIRGKWFAQVKKGGINHFCGRFDNIGEAIAARDAAAMTLHGDFAILNQKAAQL